jgi:streptogramin lyase
MRRTRVAIILVCLAACGDTGSGDNPFADGGDDVEGSGSGEAGGPGGASGPDGVDTSTGGDGSGGPKFDTPDGNTGADDGGNGECGCGNAEWSHIWVANSAQSTVSRIDTRTMIEEARYLTRADGAGNPSRTSVSLSGRAVAVANRHGGVAKIWSRPDFCDPLANGQPGLQTSSGKTDVLPWGQDDCLAWYTPFDYKTQRPVAWTGGDLEPSTCEYDNERLWTAGCSPGYPTAHLLDGDTGVVLENVTLTGFPCMTEGITFGAYGGAVDSEGNFWLSTFAQYTTSIVARVDAATLEVELWNAPIPGYGITVDRKDRVWLNGNGALGADAGTRAARFDPATGAWATAAGGAVLGQSGIQEDAFGRMWMNWWDHDGIALNGEHGGGLTYVDSETLQPGPNIDLGWTAKGVSVDVDGYVWSIALENRAIRYDPNSGDVEIYDGLDGPYTYSDMTGWALMNTECSPEG